jgi:Potassium-transporting ATPase A subunit
MTWQGWIQILIYVAALTALTPVLGGYMARVYMGRRLMLERVLGPVERSFYRAVRTDPANEQDWRQYARTVLVFSALFWLVLYAILRLQGVLPFNPLRFDGAPWNVTFNTTSSFVTNTNWQYYGGETTMSFFSQMAGLAVQNFVSAAVGMAVLAAVIRGFARPGDDQAGDLLGRPDPDAAAHPAAALDHRGVGAGLQGVVLQLVLHRRPVGRLIVTFPQGRWMPPVVRLALATVASALATTTGPAVSHDQ